MSKSDENSILLTDTVLMSDSEFTETLNLHRLGLAEWDIGYSYWHKVIKDLKAMRKVCSRMR